MRNKYLSDMLVELSSKHRSVQITQMFGFELMERIELVENYRYDINMFTCYEPFCVISFFIEDDGPIYMEIGKEVLGSVNPNYEQQLKVYENLLEEWKEDVKQWKLWKKQIEEDRKRKNYENSKKLVELFEKEVQDVVKSANVRDPDK